MDLDKDKIDGIELRTMVGFEDFSIFGSSYSTNEDNNEGITDGMIVGFVDGLSLLTIVGESDGMYLV